MGSEMCIRDSSFLVNNSKKVAVLLYLAMNTVMEYIKVEFIPFSLVRQALFNNLLTFLFLLIFFP